VDSVDFVDHANHDEHDEHEMPSSFPPVAASTQTTLSLDGINALGIKIRRLEKKCAELRDRLPVPLPDGTALSLAHLTDPETLPSVLSLAVMKDAHERIKSLEAQVHSLNLERETWKRMMESERKQHALEVKILQQQVSGLQCRIEESNSISRRELLVQSLRERDSALESAAKTAADAQDELLSFGEDEALRRLASLERSRSLLGERAKAIARLKSETSLLLEALGPKMEEWASQERALEEMRQSALEATKQARDAEVMGLRDRCAVLESRLARFEAGALAGELYPPGQGEPPPPEGGFNEKAEGAASRYPMSQILVSTTREALAASRAAMRSVGTVLPGTGPGQILRADGGLSLAMGPLRPSDSGKAESDAVVAAVATRAAALDLSLLCVDLSDKLQKTYDVICYLRARTEVFDALNDKLANDNFSSVPVLARDDETVNGVTEGAAIREAVREALEAIYGSQEGEREGKDSQVGNAGGSTGGNTGGGSFTLGTRERGNSKPPKPPNLPNPLGAPKASQRGAQGTQGATPPSQTAGFPVIRLPDYFDELLEVRPLRLFSDLLRDRNIPDVVEQALLEGKETLDAVLGEVDEASRGEATSPGVGWTEAPLPVRQEGDVNPDDLKEVDGPQERLLGGSPQFSEGVDPEGRSGQVAGGTAMQSGISDGRLEDGSAWVSPVAPSDHGSVSRAGMGKGAALALQSILSLIANEEHAAHEAQSTASTVTLVSSAPSPTSEGPETPEALRRAYDLLRVLTLRTLQSERVLEVRCRLLKTHVENLARYANRCSAKYHALDREVRGAFLREVGRVSADAAAVQSRLAAERAAASARAQLQEARAERLQEELTQCQDELRALAAIAGRAGADDAQAREIRLQERVDLQAALISRYSQLRRALKAAAGTENPLESVLEQHEPVISALEAQVEAARQGVGRPDAEGDSHTTSSPGLARLVALLQEERDEARKLAGEAARAEAMSRGALGAQRAAEARASQLEERAAALEQDNADLRHRLVLCASQREISGLFPLPPGFARPGKSERPGAAGAAPGGQGGSRTQALGV